MTWVTIVLWIIMHVPDFIAIIKAILALIHSGKMSKDTQISLKAAIVAAIHAKDIKQLESVLKSALTS